ncbi:hypothetical protein HRG_008022 [Hirsutella rhossiliensis]|uniref:Uncharacterized protein n=1 Tax=Hirsutella rhossiliensis TaxID=111463 RepID=A0A9P8MUV9_9HYPO|nr:uncharacterized protein HRG_08022 [Hirsutella rhossiliensis]KAH0960869.1 hypothetical protein HRG_08022 [Hirsutella rhossiliensis]
MLTLTQPPAPYGYKSVHDLPTPPSSFRPSPPPTHPEASHKPSPSLSRGQSPASLLMSTPHRGLPPPAAMALPPQPPPPSAVAPASHHPQPWASLPPPPQQWQGAEESMRNWLVAKAEEEKTRQESLRLEQRRVEMDILRASLTGGIPPPMIPLVFAGMGAGGTLPQAALDWAQHFMQSAQGQHAHLPPPQRPHSPELHHRRGPSPAQGHFPGPPANPAPTQGPAAYSQYPASPTRPRGQTVTGALGRHAPSVPSLGPNPAQPAPAGGGAPMAPYQQQPHVQAPSVQQDASPSIYFHHWQPPASQAGSGGPNRPGTPSGETHRKRKTTASQQHHQQQQQQQPMQAAGEQRLRSPPSFVPSSQSNPPTGRRTHKRQRSDVAWYRPPGQGQAEEPERAGRTRTPSREADTGSPREAYGAEGKMHPVSALLSREPAEGPRSHFYLGYGPQAPVAERRDEEGAARDRGRSPGRGEAKPGGGAAGSAEPFR